MKINIGDLFIWLDPREPVLGLCLEKKTIQIKNKNDIEEKFYIHWSDSQGFWYDTENIEDAINKGDMKYSPVNND